MGIKVTTYFRTNRVPAIRVQNPFKPFKTVKTFTVAAKLRLRRNHGDTQSDYCRTGETHRRGEKESRSGAKKPPAATAPIAAKEAMLADFKGRVGSLTNARADTIKQIDEQIA